MGDVPPRSSFVHGLGLGLGAALGLGLAVGLMILAAGEIEERRAQGRVEFAATAQSLERQASATAVAVERQGTAVARATSQEATRQEAAARQQAVVAAQQAREAVREATAAARTCDDPQQVVVNGSLQRERLTGLGTTYTATGTVRNTCNYQIAVSLEIRALGADGTIVTTTNEPLLSTMALRPGEERSFASLLGYRSQSDIASLRMVPRVF